MGPVLLFVTVQGQAMRDRDAMKVWNERGRRERRELKPLFI